jgi:hypothetical protein
MAAALSIGMRRARPRPGDPGTTFRPSSGHPPRPNWAPGARPVCWGVLAGPGVVSRTRAERRREAVPGPDRVSRSGAGRDRPWLWSAIVLAVACGDYGGGKSTQGEAYCRSHPASSECRYERCADGDLASCKEACELGVTYGCQRLGWDCEYRESKYCPSDAGAPGTR